MSYYIRDFSFWMYNPTYEIKYKRNVGYWNPYNYYAYYNNTEPYFTRIRYTQCEEWYSVTSYISEFWCCVSNIPFILMTAQSPPCMEERKLPGL